MNRKLTDESLLKNEEIEDKNEEKIETDFKDTDFKDTDFKDKDIIDKDIVKNNDVYPDPNEEYTGNNEYSGGYDPDTGYGQVNGYPDNGYGNDNYNNYNNTNGSTNYTTDNYYAGSRYHKPNSPAAYTFPGAVHYVPVPVVHPVYYQNYRNPAYYQYLRLMYGRYNYNYRQPSHQPYNQFNYKTYNQTNGAPGGQPYNRTRLRSPYQSIPGTYGTNSYNTQQYFSGKRYNAQQIYGSYLSTGAYLYYSGTCAKHYKRTPEITQQDMESAFDYAHHQLRDYDRLYGNYSIDHAY
ncbi:unnamed protein product [Oppiella nova]|uniref:Uncharacterized protein n=1 Tax=Oppiella nova TaxID=334625 RepID=A0A7R9M566_9ACAR|nr:unnamed protein product [Oppiella nova]CAG2170859.1 unnamed protein product [Oppiella nova]